MKTVIITAHGAPSDPAPKQAVLDALAAQVQALCPDTDIRAATLAAPGALAAALADVVDPIIYPFFMAEGWFTKREIPRRIAELGYQARHMDPFGVDPALPALITAHVLAELRAAGQDPQASDLMLFAHGSKIARRSKNSAYDMAQTLRPMCGLRTINVGLIEEPPFIGDIAKEHLTGICLPFFALRASHVDEDIPEALQNAGFEGILLPPIGEHPEIPRLIANSINLF